MAHNTMRLGDRAPTAAKARPASQVLIDRDPTWPAETPCVAIVIKGGPTEQALALTRDIREAAEKAHCSVSAVVVCDGDATTVEMVCAQVPLDAFTVVIAGDGAAEVPIGGIEDMIGAGLYTPLTPDATVQHALEPLQGYLNKWRALHANSRDVMVFFLRLRELWMKTPPGPIREALDDKMSALKEVADRLLTTTHQHRPQHRAPRRELEPLPMSSDKKLGGLLRNSDSYQLFDDPSEQWRAIVEKH